MTNIPYLYTNLHNSMQNLGIVTGACGLDICPPTHVIFIVIRRSNAFSTEYQLLMCAFQYIKQNLEINSFHKSDITSHITLKGWRVHLEKPYPSWENPIKIILRIIFHGIKSLYKFINEKEIQYTTSRWKFISRICLI